jgi:hypothetical protein
VSATSAGADASLGGHTSASIVHGREGVNPRPVCGRDLRARHVRPGIEEEQGAMKGLSSTMIIILHISSPDVPYLDLIIEVYRRCSKNTQQVFECMPDLHAQLLKLLNPDGNLFDAQVEGMRSLFSIKNQEKPQWPSAEDDKMLQDPPPFLAKRFPSVIDGIIHEMRDLKRRAGMLIRDAVTGCVQRFSDEVVHVQGWLKTLVADGVHLEVVTAER